MRLFAVKVLRLIVVVLVVTFLSFLLIELLPGDLVDKVIPFGTASPEAGAAQRPPFPNDGFFVQYCAALVERVRGG